VSIITHYWMGTLAENLEETSRESPKLSSQTTIAKQICILIKII